ncbi:acetyl-CoA carboxylase biotin carboxyl carrier protein subunit [Marinilabiliaceae bacterium ANBcel2]|nr:acetyl-CoA carboxylase biotin carboxyl carrier protein subunit [Marinilabiliaceae bacterium ANBcel2]
MKKFLITVNDKQYEVEVEEVRTVNRPASQKGRNGSKPKSLSGSGNGNGKSKSSSASSSAGAHKVSAPMPGSIFKVMVAPGDEVKKGQTLLIFEAMKMENSLTAPADGVVKEVNAVEGNNISVTDVLVVIE